MISNNKDRRLLSARKYLKEALQWLSCISSDAPKRISFEMAHRASAFAEELLNDLAADAYEEFYNND